MNIDVILTIIGIIVAIIGIIVSIILQQQNNKPKINIKKICVAQNGKREYYGVILSNNTEHRLIIDQISYKNKFKKTKRIDVILLKNDFNRKDLNETSRCNLPVKLNVDDILFVLFNKDNLKTLKNNLVKGKLFLYFRMVNGNTIKKKITRKNISKFLKNL